MRPWRSGGSTSSLALVLGNRVGFFRIWFVSDSRLKQEGAQVGRAPAFVVGEVVNSLVNGIRDGD